MMHPPSPPRYGRDVRVAVFVDVQNLFYSARDLFGGKVDFSKLLHETVRDRRLVAALAYVSVAEDVDMTSFLNVLEHLGYYLRVKPQRKRPDGTHRSDWKVGMTVDALTLAPKVDVAVLVTGDGEYTELVQALKRFGVLVEVASFPRSTSKELRHAADRFVPLGPGVIIEQPPEELPPPGV